MLPVAMAIAWASAAIINVDLGWCWCMWCKNSWGYELLVVTGLLAPPKNTHSIDTNVKQRHLADRDEIVFGAVDSRLLDFQLFFDGRWVLHD